MNRTIQRFYTPRTSLTLEGDAHPNFKRVLAEAPPEDIVTFMSVAGLPARELAGHLFGAPAHGARDDPS